ncbi:MAG: hypothetical protein ACE5KM_24690, partial [Planctomycetaceae bacterium]
YKKIPIRARRTVKKLEKADGSRRIAVYFARPDRSLTQHDILPFSSMLKSIGAVGDLDLVVVSNGGDGMAAEKMLALCRRYCSGKLRVVVPLYAKSAATLIALGADEIVMGETSELGPIDAQVFIIQDNADQQVSADNFLRARDHCLKELGSGDSARVEAAQIQLSLLSPAFIQHCEDLMNFGRDFARKQLQSHMLAAECATDQSLWQSRIDRIVSNLTATSKHLLHGRMITAEDIQTDPELCHLKVTALDAESEYWVLLNELLLRMEIVAQIDDLGKILFTRSFQLAST